MGNVMSATHRHVQVLCTGLCREQGHTELGLTEIHGHFSFTQFAVPWCPVQETELEADKGLQYFNGTALFVCN